MASVSVIIPVYNTEKYLEQCLDSLINQSLTDIEIICIDDGSTDSSLDILNHYANKHNNIRVISKNNTGYGNTVNIGIDNATCKYIGIIEPDDFIEKNMFEVLYNNAVNNDLDVSRCTFYYYNETTGENEEEEFPFMVKNVVYAPRNKKETFYQQPTVWINLYRKQFLDENKIRFLETPGASYQDTSFLFKVYACANRFMIDDRPLHHYRVNENSSVKQISTKAYCVCTEYQEIWRYISEKGMIDEYKHIITQLQYYGYKWSCLGLAEDLRMPFIQRWHDDLIELKKAGYIRRFDYLPSDYRIITRILKYDHKYNNSVQFGLIDAKGKKARKMSSKFGLLARLFVRIRM